MALAADHSTLPTAAVSGGLIPDDEPRFVQALAEHWQVTNDDQVADTGTFWACGYCNFRTVCATTEAGRIPVTAVTITEKNA